MKADWRIAIKVYNRRPNLKNIQDAGERKGHGSDLKNRTSKSFPRYSSASEIHSSAVCACAMLPGPNTTLGIPPAASTAASQK